MNTIKWQTWAACGCLVAVKVHRLGGGGLGPQPIGYTATLSVTQKHSCSCCMLLVALYVLYAFALRLSLLKHCDSKLLQSTTAAVFYLTSSRRSSRSSLCCRQAGFSGFCCHRLERPASPRRICTVTRGFQTTRDLSVFPFVPRHYDMTHVLLLPFITTVWTPVVLAIINIT